jgi:cellulose synthase/poly-beta-1,6-N-acetylglucosamine synthase-like glycosyltransferase
MQWLPAILILPYFILLLNLYRSLLRIKPFKSSAYPNVFVSLVVACRNEEKHLPSLLYDIAQQGYPKQLFEVIVIDDHSTDSTFDIADKFSGINNITTLNNRGKGKKQALRTGIDTAKGELIITTDADCRMGTDRIRSIASFFERNIPDMIICPVKLESTSTVLGRLQELEFMSLQGITAATAISGSATMCNGANLAFTRDAYLLHSANLHDEINSGDDIFLLHSLKHESGSKILWMESQEAIITTEAASGLGSFIKQRSRWISKGRAYRDRNTIILSSVTFLAVILQFSFLIGALIQPALITVFLSVLILKSVPDFLILEDTCRRYGKRKLLWWFVPAQLLYPFYVLSVVIYPVISGRE